MPLYEYQCDACGHRFEKIQKFSDPIETTCPKCGGSIRKLMSSPAIQFKGSGWYITDYAKKDTSPAGDTKGTSDGAKETKGTADTTPKETKSDTATKTDTSSAAPAAKESKP